MPVKLKEAARGYNGRVETRARGRAIRNRMDKTIGRYTGFEEMKADEYRFGKAAPRMSGPMPLTN